MSTITVGTLNLRGIQNRWRQRRHLVVSELLDRRPHLLALQEVYMPLGQGEWIRDQVNVRLGEGERYRLLLKRRYHLWHGYFEGVGVLTRLPVRATDGVSLGYGGRVALRVNVEVPAGQSVDFVSTHLHAARYEPETRREQVLKLVGWLNQLPREPRQIVAGDFNEVPSGTAIRQMKQSYVSAMETVRGAEPPATFPTALRTDATGWSGCLDYIFLRTTTGRVRSATIFARTPADEDDTLYPSDHVGLLATITIS